MGGELLIYNLNQGVTGSSKVGPGSEFGFENCLQFFSLLPPTPETDPNQVRHTLGFDSDALPVPGELLIHC